MPLSLLILPLLLQSGPSLGDAAPVRLPQIDRPARRSTTQATPPALPAPAAIASPLRACLDAATRDPAEGKAMAQAQLRSAGATATAARAEAQMCLGSALTGQGDWDGAISAFVAGRDLATDGNRALRARLGAMAGNAQLVSGDAAAALLSLDGAVVDARAAGVPALLGGIAVDRARALVALGKPQEAVSALAEARASQPGDAQTWLLSATLSRRLGDLAHAQSQIEAAAKLAPTDPDIGLEAGAIAILSGHEDAARKSWDSVVAAAPASEAANRARAYLAQLGPQKVVQNAPKPTP